MKSKKALIIVFVVLAVAIAAVLGFNMKPSKEAEHDYFLADQMTTMIILDAANPGKIVKNLGHRNLSMPYVSKDDSTLILLENSYGYPEALDGNLIHFDLSSEVETLIAKNIDGFVVSSDFKTFLYMKENDSTLYKKSVFDAEPEIIAKKVCSYYMSDDAQTIIYTTTSDGTYLKNGTSEAILLGKSVNIRHFEKTTGDFVYMVYDDASKLIVHKNGTDTVVTENLYTGDGPGHIGSCDTFYFFEEQEKLDPYSLFEDDLKETLRLSDAEIDEFYNLLNIDIPHNNSYFHLRKAFYYDNGKISEVCDNIIETVNSTARSPADKVAAIFRCFDTETKIKLSDLYAYEIDPVFGVPYYSIILNLRSTYRVIKKEQIATTDLGTQNVWDCKYDYLNNEMYIFTSENVNDVSLSNIYKTSLNIGSDELTLIDQNDDIMLTTAAVFTDGIFYQRLNSSTYDFCHNGEILVSDIEYFYDMEADNAYYISAFEGDNKKGILYFDGEIHEYPDIDLSSHSVYSTPKGNFIIWNIADEHYYTISGKNVLRFDGKFVNIDVPSEEPNYHEISTYFSK